MKKKGFTLSELIIAMSIVGVVAVISAPMLGNLVPDQNKVTVLKTCKLITDKNQEMLEESGLFSDGACKKRLDCNNIPANPKYREFPSHFYQSNNKYPWIFIDKLGDYLEEYNPVAQDPNGRFRFTTTDGMLWDFRLVAGWENEDYRIEIDVNGENEGENCSFALDCQKPDRYAFRVNRYGYIRGEDAMSQAYLENPNKMNDRKNDTIRANEILVGD